MAAKLWIILSVVFLSSQSECQEAVLHVSKGYLSKEYCLVYNSSLSNISDSLSNAVRYQLVNLTSTLLCDPGSLKQNSLLGKAVVVLRGTVRDCALSQKARVAQYLGAAVLLIASTDPMGIPSVNVTESEKVTIPFALMRFQDFMDAQKVFAGEMEVQLYALPVLAFDCSILLMLALAIFTVAMGGFWSGAAERAKQSGAAVSGGEDGADSGDLSLYSPLKVLLFVLLMCVMLVLMYFFYKWLVYVVIVIFCLASATALYSCLDGIMNAVGCSKFSVSCGERSCSVRSLLLTSVCITLAVIWGVYRNEDRWIWILQDLLGVAFCLNFMKTITLSNYKICIILLSLLLVYDVFFVFITPFFTPNGESIMVQVALGPGAGGEKTNGDFMVPADSSTSYEKLPVVMRIPRLSAWVQNLCVMQFSILGYGDIIIPGMLVAYCHRFDVWTNSSKRIYFTCCTIAYSVGLVVTFVVMLLSKMGQPALLYLVPFTLITSAVVACVRKEFKQFWAGTTYQVLDSSRDPLSSDGEAGYSREVRKC
ncbi:signal peptide peptidase-like 2A isoform X1 [Electrophorus electricus]|uniref:PA domain-containing protein n=1 Tax=Electrophorus electricus TaxID=8005 RepID=A0A4W4HBW1_ELEEL|nr:signal peptide peptidase-like 2A isoform X1 [Electrophorus electricus]